MVPTALVRPSLNTSFWSQCRYSGVLMKRKWTVALSPVLRQSLFIDRIVAVCLMLPQWTNDTEGEWHSYRLARQYFSFRKGSQRHTDAHRCYLNLWVSVFTNPWPGISGISWSDGEAPKSLLQIPRWPVASAWEKPSPFLSLWMIVLSEKTGGEKAAGTKEKEMKLGDWLRQNWIRARTLPAFTLWDLHVLQNWF